MAQPADVEDHQLQPSGGIPNHPTLPLRIYRQAIDLRAVDDPAAAFERTFAEHGWGGSWRNGVFDFHHHHPNAHEALGIARGHARVQFGGPDGPAIHLAAGDTAVLPPGTGHCRLDASADLLVIGAYPADQHDYDTARPDDDLAAARRRIDATPLPARDPVTGGPPYA